MRAILLLCASLPILVLAPAADAAIDPCQSGVEGHRVCVERSGACVDALYVPPFTDFFAGAGSCPDVAAGSEGATACEEAWAGYVTLAGFFGVYANACAHAYEDEAGRTCVRTLLATNLLDPASSSARPLCV